MFHYKKTCCMNLIDKALSLSLFLYSVVTYLFSIWFWKDVWINHVITLSSVPDFALLRHSTYECRTNHFVIAVTSWWARWRLKSPAPRSFVHAQIKEYIKLRIIGLCEWKPPVTGGSHHKGPLTRKMFPFDDIIYFLVGIKIQINFFK